MHVSAFVPVVSAVDSGSGVNAIGFPMSTFSVDEFPIGVQVPIVLSVWAEGGGDYDPHLYAIAHDPDGERRGTVEILWHWPDVDGQPCKVGVRVVQLAFAATKPGTYRVGLYNDLDSTETDHSFPLVVTPSVTSRVGLHSSNILRKSHVRR